MAADQTPHVQLVVSRLGTPPDSQEKRLHGIVPGTQLGRYEIRSKIGEGGMGEVYLAEDAQLRRRVGIPI